ncbi:MAG: hypothetical protein ABWK00_06175 [Desulfurococcaceae archaeon]
MEELRVAVPKGLLRRPLLSDKYLILYVKARDEEHARKLQSLRMKILTGKWRKK